MSAAASVSLVVCDMAGTTVEDAGQVARAFSEALSAFGVEVGEERLRSVRGASKREAIRALLSGEPGRESEAQAAYQLFCKLLRERYAGEEPRPVAGAPEVFEWLRARAVRVALNTGFDREITELLLASLGWTSDVVDAVVCGEEVPQGRPAPYMIFRAMEKTGILCVHHVANVGDTALDLQAGHNAGVRWNVGVLSGAHERSTLETAPHTHVLPSIASLPELWEL